MKKISYYITALGAIFFLCLYGCTGINKPVSVQEQEELHDDHEMTEGMAVLSKTQRDAIELKIGKIVDRVMTGTLITNGRLVISPSQKAEITTYIGGRIKQILVMEGQKVRKGQVLIILSDPNIITIQQTFLENYNKLTFLKKELDRQKILFQNDVASGKQYQKATAQYKSLFASYKGQKIQLEMLGFNVDRIQTGYIYSTLKILAPISGYIGNVKVKLGEFIDANSHIANVFDTDNLHADLKVYEKDVRYIKPNLKVRLRATTNPNIELTGEIFSIGKELDKGSKTIIIHSTIDQKDPSLKVDGYVYGDILIGGEMISSVPESAVVQQSGKSYIFVLNRDVSKKIQSHEKDEVSKIENGEISSVYDEKWAFDMIEVIVTQKQNKYLGIQLSKPLSANSEVVLNGAFYLLSDMKKGEAKHSH
ncbi:efflux RND transporter periplasmic adaptor subunit [Halosquirtibacter xylanolyticus]|uniref:efflux RND transporter periplasmic adaptor subunit n=1 Tax=Halosquirtibacter xylanolyticus TaxID=3374599 RepID=UPI003747FFD3|nr:efflux RND transporter periplasmic adaptor subunit [Prolixibacteraceae bacterium]